jgi:hypothetical protein
MNTNQPNRHTHEEPNSKTRASRQVVKSITDSAIRSRASTEERNTHPCITIRWWAPSAFSGRQLERDSLGTLDLAVADLSMVCGAAGWWSGC